MNQKERLSSYSKFRVALALDHSLDSSLRGAMQQRVNAFSVNPLETSAQSELRAALRRYDHLLAATGEKDGPLAKRLEKDRRGELARFEAGNAQQVRLGILHYATFSWYSPRAAGDDFLARLDKCRQADYYLTFLDGLAAAGTQPEVAYDRARIQQAISDLTSLLPEMEAPGRKQHAEQTIERLHALSADTELRAECAAALDSIRDPAPFSGVEEGSGSPETFR
jgi:hypothetical protein